MAFEPGALRRALFAAAVLDGVDLVPHADGMVLSEARNQVIRWADWAAALDGADPGTLTGRARLTRYARARIMLSGAGRVPARPYGVPIGDCRHPGPSWLRRAVPGGALEVGVGIAGLHPDVPERVLPLPSGLAGYGGSDSAWLDQAMDYLDQMAVLALARLARRPDDTLRPMGQCDVLALLGARTFRAGLVGAAGLRTAAVPMRERGWLDLRRIDPDFVGCAAAATDPELRGFPEPLLVTADELRRVRSVHSHPSAASRRF